MRLLEATGPWRAFGAAATAEAGVSLEGFLEDMTEQDERGMQINAGWVRPAHQTRSRAQRDRLLKAGERVFASKGFWQAHVTDIAAVAECSVGSFYRRFKDKEALFFALQEDMAARARHNLETTFDDPRWMTEPLIANLERLMRNTARTMQGIEGYYRALYEMSLRGHEVWRPMRTLERYQAERMVEILDRRGASRTDDAVVSAQMVVRMVHGIILSTIIHQPGPYGPGDPKFHRELAELCLRHLTVAPGGPKA